MVWSHVARRCEGVFLMREWFISDLVHSSLDKWSFSISFFLSHPCGSSHIQKMRDPLPLRIITNCWMATGQRQQWVSMKIHWISSGVHTVHYCALFTSHLCFWWHRRPCDDIGLTPALSALLRSFLADSEPRALYFVYCTGVYSTSEQYKHTIRRHPVTATWKIS